VTEAVVLDASALLALLQAEPGADVVAAVVANAHFGAANLTEAMTRMIDRGRSVDGAWRAIERLSLTIEPVDADLAIAAAALRGPTRSRGLSLGDRLCLALGQRLGAAVYTADRSWDGLDIGIDVRLIR
jgi:ribonuclease VapC